MLRRQLVELACEKGFSHREVIELSQRLDKYIVQLQSRMNVKKSIN
ncbi:MULTISPECIES: aspartyl-phosphate phosphatase Spo0E family protein [Brevibacillus]|nr:aspartyl-phosphate phosphatase Spo0E family protein [Brevibacillus borstelensis]MBE5394114.1 aspartyl-phosphate phosphatase Spo0E family protein [Brevibacillus borstelensis]MCC0566849.1 aspartyl-phosphate phosphatase Spo0E family protein [Brevibacillus borstelensis]MCM3473461.1 aspartyl-phosphate phosphatase Spo0E family protein [Brevibacillus borstelensis]MCM3561376.1 aspartyl-phosphate phosphatase Spo0E family protein [Brevibacillus borstelensis]MCM3591687.1 aspartyl-phosphate phosphatase